VTPGWGLLFDHAIASDHLLINNNILTSIAKAFRSHLTLTAALFLSRVHQDVS
jgi:hypothetical protein